MNAQDFEEAKQAIRSKSVKVTFDAKLFDVFGSNTSLMLYESLDKAYLNVLNGIKEEATELPDRIAKAMLLTKIFWVSNGGDFDELERDRSKVAEGKREDYTKGDEDVLKNFKNQSEVFGIDPKISLGVHMEKQMSAVLNYIKTDGKSESEPIIKRVGDVLNYLELLYGLWVEGRKSKPTHVTMSVEELTKKPKDEEPSQTIKQTAICEKCERNFASDEERERECNVNGFICPHRDNPVMAFKMKPEDN